MDQIVDQYKKSINDEQTLNVANQALDQAYKNLKTKIKQGDLQINQEPHHISVSKPPNDESVIQKKIHEIGLKRSKVEQKLQQIQLEQKKAKDQLRSVSMPNIQGLPRSELKKQDVNKWQQLIRKHKEHKQQLKEKTQKHDEFIKKAQQEKQQQIRRRKEEIEFQRKQKAQKNIQIIKKRQEERKKIKIEEKDTVQRLMSRMTMYKKMEKDWKKVQQEELKEREHMKKLIKQRKKVDFEKLKIHQTKYNEIMNKNKEPKNISKQHQEQQKFYKSVFMSRVVQEDSRIKQQLFAKKNLAKAYSQKKDQYAKLVKKNFKPKIQQKPQNDDPKELSTIRSMSLLEIYRKGNDYMKEINKKAKEDNPYKKQRQLQKIQNKTYHDYLTEMRLRKEEKGEQNYHRYEEEINKIMTQDDLTSEQKLQRVKTMNRNIESSPNKDNNPYKLIGSISAKMQILKGV